MKKLLFCVFENNEYTLNLFDKLTNSHIDGTVLHSTSIKHILNNNSDDLHFLTLRHFESSTYEDASTFYCTLSEEKLKIATDIIRQETKNFTLIKGDMLIIPIDSYEGSF